LLSVTKANCSIARATNQTESFESDQPRSRTSFFVRCDGLVQSRNWNSSRSSRAERPPDKRKTAERYRAGRPLSHLTLTKGTTMKLAKRSEERRVGKECRARKSPDH